MASSADVVQGTNAVANDHNLLRADVVLGLLVTGTDTDGATITFDLSDKTKGKIRFVQLGGNRTLALSNPTTGQAFMLRIKQSGGGGNTVTWFSGITWPAGIVPTLTTTGNKEDDFLFICTGVGAYNGYIVAQNI